MSIQGSTMRPPGTRQTIVVVDDSEVCREIAMSLLSDLGYQVIVVADPLALADALRAARPALALVDFNMPKIDGDELLQLVRAEGILHCPFVLHSDRTEEELEVIAKRCGAAGYIRKTANMEKLRTSIERFLPRTPID
jgi:CheY-like chemotaxis protein